MRPDRWSRVDAIVDHAAGLPPSERSAFLHDVCGGDAGMLGEAESLLAARLEAFSDQTIETVESPRESDLTGRRLGRYSIVEFIGEGGMGAVYRAMREDDFRMQVAIKVLKRGAESAAAVSRFRTERQILAGLQHPNIARLLDGGATDTGLPYLVMEYVAGTPLLQFTAPLPIQRRLELFCSICAAVEYAHRHQVVHRDLKPANILVTPEGIPKLLDFGIAKLLDRESGETTVPLTGPGVRLMTPEYASPEQVRGDLVTAATDTYSLGAVLYELLTGKPAHHLDSYSPAAIQNEICAHEPQRPSAAAPDLDPDLDHVVRMAMHKDPQQRYASTAELSDDISRFLQGHPVRARKPALGYRAAKFMRRRRVPAIAAAASALLVLAILAGLGRLSERRGPADAALRSIAVLPLENLSGDPQQEYFADGITDALIGDLARVRALRVISRTSVMSYKGVRRKLPDVARSLGVDTIAEGSVLRAGDRIRISVRLIDGSRDRPVWSGSYEGELRDVLALQSQVAGAVAAEIHVTLTAGNAADVSRHKRVNLQAYDAYLKGRHQYSMEFTQKSIEKAISWFQQALVSDAGYAPAYAGLADCYYMLSNLYLPPTEMMPKAKWAALKAIEIDDTLGDAHATLALVRSVYEFDRDAAEKGFRRAIELKPSHLQAHLWYSLHLSALGRFDEALAEAAQAQKLDPASPAMNGYAAMPLLLAGRSDDVIRRMQPVTDVHPDYYYPYAMLASAYEQKGEWAKAIAAMEKAYQLDGQLETLAQLGYIYGVAGRIADARRALRLVSELSRRRYVSAYNFALLHLALGERDAAFDWLQKVETDRSEWFAMINVDWRLKALRSDPRFAALLRSAGLS
jgi:serine/threonine-protein kinase